MRGLVEVVAKAEFALVEAKGLCADDRAAEPEDAGSGERVEKRAGRPVDAEEPFRAQDADGSRPRGLCLGASPSQNGGTPGRSGLRSG